MIGAARNVRFVPLLDVVVDQSHFGIVFALGDPNLLIRLKDPQIEQLDLRPGLHGALQVFFVGAHLRIEQQCVLDLHRLIERARKVDVEGGPCELGCVPRRHQLLLHVRQLHLGPQHVVDRDDADLVEAPGHLEIRAPRRHVLLGHLDRLVRDQDVEVGP